MLNLLYFFLIKSVLLLKMNSFNIRFSSSIRIRSIYPVMCQGKAIPFNTQRIFENMQIKDFQVGGAGGSSSLDGLVRLEKTWNDLKNGGWEKAVPEVVFQHDSSYEISDKVYDVTIVGGTLGVFYALDLQMRGFQTCITERGIIAGRPQEWNISKKELNTLVRLGLLTDEEIGKILSIEFNPVRVGFKTDTSTTASDKGFECYVDDILNLGVRPDILISIVKEKYLSKGGIIYENTPVSNIDVYNNVATITLQDSTSKRTSTLSSRLIIDAMGNASPIAKQIRGPVEPDGICGRNSPRPVSFTHTY